ncbi:MAG TPA: hypothetical protein VFR56_09360 [Actinomycetes bacterium]|nr:hypothetical protein [Actinomycetes bacterium]
MTDGEVAVAEVLLVVAALAVPLVLGAAAGATGRPWWWAALAAVVLFLAAAILPAPEEGEPRVAAGDIGFLAVVALVVAGLTWAAAAATRRLTARRGRAAPG